jgi:eukaryotic-like serine/threonine-protein kinase
MTGKLLGNRYELIDRIDSGGMADIYSAKCKKTGNIFAVKILKDKFSDNAEYINRFKKEAEVVFALDHPNIVRIYDIGNDNGVYYIVMEYVEGSTLKALIDKKKSIPENEAIKYALQVCSALSLAHENGIIHRDIKPQNILINKEGNLKLTDFGIATSLTSKQVYAKQVIGSVYYISPEQARGEEAGACTDIYSLGIVLYEMLTGSLPHTGKTVSVALKHINEQITPPKDIKNDISNSINNIVLKATCKNKSERYKTINEFKDDLILSLADPDGSFVDIPPNIQYSAERAASRKKKNTLLKIGILIIFAGVVLALIITGLILFNTSNQNTVKVPDLVGMNIQSAESNAGNLKINASYEASETIAEGSVISQSPQAGSFAAEGSSLNLTISDGPGDLSMPDLAGKSLDEAKDIINSMGLSVDDSNISYEFNANVPAGSVISQIPEYESPVSDSDVISLIISREDTPSGALMPDVAGKQIDEAVPLLSGMGFYNCFVYEDEDDNKQVEGTVIRQSPNKGEQALFSDEVYITISKYKDKKYKGSINTDINITESKSTVRIIVQETIGQYTVNFVKEKDEEDTGLIPLNLDLYSRTGGKKTVIIYINKIETNSLEVDFAE